MQLVEFSILGLFTQRGRIFYSNVQRPTTPSAQWTCRILAVRAAMRVPCTREARVQQPCCRYSPAQRSQSSPKLVSSPRDFKYRNINARQTERRGLRQYHQTPSASSRQRHVCMHVCTYVLLVASQLRCWSLDKCEMPQHCYLAN